MFALHFAFAYTLKIRLCGRGLMIPSADFIGQTATSGSASPGVPHDLNVRPRCAGWRFTVCCRGKLQSFETSLSCHEILLENPASSLKHLTIQRLNNSIQHCLVQRCGSFDVNFANGTFTYSADVGNTAYYRVQVRKKSYGGWFQLDFNKEQLHAINDFYLQVLKINYMKKSFK